MGESERYQEAAVSPPGSARPVSHPESPVRPSRRRRSSSRSPKSRRGLRAGYFALASIWGCLVGTGVLVLGLSLLGRPIHFGSTVAGFLGLATIIAAVGGLLVATAYRAASRRYR